MTTSWATVVAITEALRDLPLDHRLKSLVAVLGKQVRDGHLKLVTFVCSVSSKVACFAQDLSFEAIESTAVASLQETVQAIEAHGLVFGSSGSLNQLKATNIEFSVQNSSIE